MTFDGSALRQSSDASLPFRDRGVTLVRLRCDGVVEQARTLEEKRDVLHACDPMTGCSQLGLGSVERTSSGLTKSPSFAMRLPRT